MFGSRILDILIGLSFVYLLLSLICSAISEYIASMTNKRGKVLIQGIEALVRDREVLDAFYSHPLVRTLIGDYETFQRYVQREKNIKHVPVGFRWIFRLISWLTDARLRRYRLPSYLASRTFALALLDATGFMPGSPPDAGAPRWWVPEKASGAASPPADEGPWQGFLRWLRGFGSVQRLRGDAEVPPSPSAANAPPQPSDGVQLEHVLQTLLKDSRLELGDLGTLGLADRLSDANLPAGVKRRLEEWYDEGNDRLQKMHNSVEVWFNNRMDRISGDYKRHTQAVLFVLGVLLAGALNADTVDLWHRLSSDEKLREGIAVQAAKDLPRIATLMADSATGTTRHPPADTTTAASDSTNANAGGSSTVTTGTAGASAPADTGGAANGGTTGSSGGTTTNPPAPNQTNPNGANNTRKDTTSSDTALARARARYDSAMAMLDRTNLNFGWGWDDAVKLGFARKLTARDAKQVQAARIRRDSTEIAREDSAEAAKAFSGTGKAATVERGRRIATAKAAAGFEARKRNSLPGYVRAWSPRWGPIGAKLLGLLLTAFALTLGAPFWFDTLNKIINVRAAGRAPQETARRPAVTAKTGTGAAPS